MSIITSLVCAECHVSYDTIRHAFFRQAVMAGMGNAMMGTGEAEGEGRAVKAAEDALCNPLLGELSVKVRL